MQPINPSHQQLARQHVRYTCTRPHRLSGATSSLTPRPLPWLHAISTPQMHAHKAEAAWTDQPARQTASIESNRRDKLIIPGQSTKWGMRWRCGPAPGSQGTAVDVSQTAFRRISAWMGRMSVTCICLGLGLASLKRWRSRRVCGWVVGRFVLFRATRGSGASAVQRRPSPAYAWSGLWKRRRGATGWLAGMHETTYCLLGGAHASRSGLRVSVAGCGVARTCGLCVRVVTTGGHHGWGSV